MDLRKTRSFENLTDPTEQEQGIYRNPERERLQEDQSLIDRMSMAAISNKYESGQQSGTPIEPTAPVLPERNEIKGAIKPNKFVVAIVPFDGVDPKESVEDWFFRYEFACLTNNWDTNLKRNYLLFHLKLEPYRYCFQIWRENPDISYLQLKEKLIQRFTQEYDPTLFTELNNRQLKKQDNLQEYWSDKLELINKVDPRMSFQCKCNYLIDGLSYKLYEDVLKFNTMNKPTNVEELFKNVKKLYDIERSSREKREYKPNQVKFEEKFPSKKSWEGKTNYPKGSPGMSNPRAFWTTNPKLATGNLWHNSGNKYNLGKAEKEPYQQNYGGPPNQKYNPNPNPNYNPNYKPNYKTNYSPNQNPNYNPNKPNYNPNYKSNNNSNYNPGFPGNAPGRPQSPKVHKPKYTPDGTPICFICGEPGHMTYSCPQKKEEKPENLN